jgi:PAS domain S-box-containing protein
LSEFPLSKIKVIHLDDDENQLQMFKNFITLYDCEIQVDSFSSVSEAMLRLKDVEYDCLVIDYKMPEMTGIEFTKKLREFSSIPIILYTGQGSEEVAEAAFSMGIDDYIRKEMSPQHYKVLAKRIRDVVESRQIINLHSNVVEKSPEPIAIAINGILVYGNSALADLLGESSFRNLYGKNGLEILFSNFKDPANQHIREVLSGKKEKIRSEVEIRRRDGKRIQIETMISKIKYRGENAILCFANDISERKALEEEITKSEARFKSLVNLAPDGLVIVNLRGTITWVNDQFLKITGYEKDEIVGKLIFSIGTLKATSFSQNIKLFLQVIQGKEIPPIDFKWVKKDGTECWGEGRASLVKSDSGKTELLVSARDITDRKKLEDELKNYSKNLERLADERAKKLLDSEKITAAGTIASTVAHDLRGPLGTIRNAIYIMKLKPEKAEEMMCIIEKAVDNSVGMLEELRGQMSEKPLDRVDTELSGFIKMIIDEMPIPPGIKIHCELNETKAWIDPFHMRRVVENLIRNAVDSISGNGKITVSVFMKGENAIIKVSDNGRGISKEAMSNLFRPFYTTKSKGTGLGLHYCKQAVEKHGGEIRVDSKEGAGASFSIVIPVQNRGEKEIEVINR